MTGRVHSIETFSTLDGPGIRSVVFLQGCALRCAYCHNPDTWAPGAGTRMSAAELFDKLMPFANYYKGGGGITFSGGEPLLQADFVAELAEMFAKEGIGTAVETAGSALTPDVERLLDLLEYVLLDIKFTSDGDYKRYCGGGLSTALSFLDRLKEKNIKTIIRHVVVGGLNDDKDDILRLCEILRGRENIIKVELLPMRKLCISKYEALGIPFPFAAYGEPDGEKMRVLSDIPTREGL